MNEQWLKRQYVLFKDLKVEGNIALKSKPPSINEIANVFLPNNKDIDDYINELENSTLGLISAKLKGSELYEMNVKLEDIYISGWKVPYEHISLDKITNTIPVNTNNPLMRDMNAYSLWRNIHENK